VIYDIRDPWVGHTFRGKRALTIHGIIPYYVHFLLFPPPLHLLSQQSLSMSQDANLAPQYGVGAVVGSRDGAELGARDCDGAELGAIDEVELGAMLGVENGAGTGVGAELGTTDGAELGTRDGAELGLTLGVEDGAEDAMARKLMSPV
jgi:hypothetical protein